jgi:hypothetical protein
LAERAIGNERDPRNVCVWVCVWGGGVLLQNAATFAAHARVGIVLARYSICPQKNAILVFR